MINLKLRSYLKVKTCNDLNFQDAKLHKATVVLTMQPTECPNSTFLNSSLHHTYTQ